MSFATRCTACGTIFRVVQDQLRVSEGWVRCGRCTEVFDAREQLFDIDHDAPPPWPSGEGAISAPAPVPLAAQHDEAPEPSWETDTEPLIDDPEAEDARFDQDTVFLEPEPEVAEAYAPPPQPTVADERREPFWAPPDESPRADFVDSRSDLPEPRGLNLPPRTTTPPPEPNELDELPDVVLSPGLSTPLAPADEDSDADVVQPSFLRRAEGRARWQRPAVRFTLGLLSGFLILGVVVQLGWHYREPLAARSPQARALLTPLCAGLGQPLQAWRHLAALRVESSALTPAGSGNHYRFSMTLRNKSEWELALPWVELSLSDLKGKPVLKRALGPQDFRLKHNTIGAGAEQSLELVFSSGKLPVSGYTVDIFHP